MSQSKPRVLVTGAAGVIGSRIAADLARDYELVLTDLRAGTCDAGPIAPLDITDSQQTRRAMEGVDLVVHLAIATMRAMRDRPQHAADDEQMRVNVIGTQHVFEAARQAGVRRVAFASSVTTLIGEPRYAAVDADTPPRPVNLYACTKLFGEHLAELYARTHGLPVVCLRFGQPYPVPIHGSPARLKLPECRGLMVAFEDLAHAVRRALDERGPRFAIATIISESDARTLELVGADAIGYRPQVYFTEDGPVPNPMLIAQRQA